MNSQSLQLGPTGQQNTAQPIGEPSPSLRFNLFPLAPEVRTLILTYLSTQRRAEAIAAATTLAFRGDFALHAKALLEQQGRPFLDEQVRNLALQLQKYTNTPPVGTTLVKRMVTLPIVLEGWRKLIADPKTTQRVRAALMTQREELIQGLVGQRVNTSLGALDWIRFDVGDEMMARASAGRYCSAWFNAAHANEARIGINELVQIAEKLYPSIPVHDRAAFFQERWEHPVLHRCREWSTSELKTLGWPSALITYHHLLGVLGFRLDTIGLSDAPPRGPAIKNALAAAALLQGDLRCWPAVRTFLQREVESPDVLKSSRFACNIAQQILEEGDKSFKEFCRQDLHQLLETRRSSLGLTYQDLGDLLSTSASAVSNVVSGRLNSPQSPLPAILVLLAQTRQELLRWVAQARENLRIARQKARASSSSTFGLEAAFHGLAPSLANKQLIQAPKGAEERLHKTTRPLHDHLVRTKLRPSLERLVELYSVRTPIDIPRMLERRHFDQSEVVDRARLAWSDYKALKKDGSVPLLVQFRDLLSTLGEPLDQRHLFHWRNNRTLAMRERSLLERAIAVIDGEQKLVRFSALPDGSNYALRSHFPIEVRRRLHAQQTLSDTEVRMVQATVQALPEAPHGISGLWGPRRKELVVKFLKLACSRQATPKDVVLDWLNATRSNYTIKVITLLLHRVSADEIRSELLGLNPQQLSFSELLREKQTLLRHFSDNRLTERAASTLSPGVQAFCALQSCVPGITRDELLDALADANILSCTPTAALPRETSKLPLLYPSLTISPPVASKSRREAVAEARSWLAERNLLALKPATNPSRRPSLSQDGSTTMSSHQPKQPPRTQQTARTPPRSRSREILDSARRMVQVAVQTKHKMSSTDSGALSATGDASIAQLVQKFLSPLHSHEIEPGSDKQLQFKNPKTKLLKNISPLARSGLAKLGSLLASAPEENNVAALPSHFLTHLSEQQTAAIIDAICDLSDVGHNRNCFAISDNRAAFLHSLLKELRQILPGPNVASYFFSRAMTAANVISPQQVSSTASNSLQLFSSALRLLAQRTHDGHQETCRKHNDARGAKEEPSLGRDETNLE